ncbi:acetyl-CoA synthetase-like protein [Gonapodya prolifera JEL478]|uniref:Acetyl-CoA synthetase-like protein n=1 Tax=Gonapodya prolifera (strain JEL478) TaxID=1344416 RepID=A0A139AXQ5_GONPJ|nr:acetyl-CoA synthetase-like protein [Gonapodya prolifera JEL478]|eukprot:KXS21487.1 acetyl-CoA synthetase-like protein [Gonapodya prolifera JEL478]
MEPFLINNAHSLLAASSALSGSIGAGIGLGLGALAYVDAKYNIGGDLTKFSRDLQFMRQATTEISRNRFHALWMFRETVARLPNKVAIRNHDFREWSYSELDKVTTRIANFLLDQGHTPGDAVALMFESNAQLCFSMLGSLKGRFIMAPQNTNLRGQPLLHCIKIAGSRALIFEPTYIPAIREIAPQLRELGVKLYFWAQSEDKPPREPEEVLDFEVDAIISERRLAELGPSADSYNRIHEIMLATQPTDKALIIYTTTGLPKGGMRDHFYLALLKLPSFPLVYLSPLEDDVHMGATPLYHAQAFGPFFVVLSRGGTFVPLRKFSASKFWQQCIDYQVTSFFYLGELCRYLLAQPPQPTDRLHKVRRVTGAGLRKEIFNEFYTRFNLDVIMEFYAASDGTSFVANEYRGGLVGVGSIGRRGPILRTLVGSPRIIKVDEFTEEPIRDPKTGLCIECKPGEPGDCIGTYDLEGPGQPTYSNNAAATNKKLLRDVFRKGDAWWRMGDLIVRDVEGWYWFSDRIGDTFRWKAENVSTQEVGNMLATCRVIQEANVYGVPVPGNDGNAGMAGVVIHESHKSRPNEDIMQELGRHAVKVLPRYAVPIFIRVLPEMEITGTLKHRKYRKEGFAAADFWMPPGTDTYVPITTADKQKLAGGTAKL